MCLRKRGIENKSAKEKAGSAETFYIPTENNTITATDINKAQVRITSENKKYFPEYDCDVRIIIANASYAVKFRLGNNKDKTRSHFIKLGREIIDLLELSSGERLIVKRIDEQSYNIEKA